MTEAQHTHHQHPNYMAVFFALLVLTVISVGVDMVGGKSQGGMTIIMLVAVCKSVLVAMYFMHLKYDWFQVYIMVVGPLIMGTIMICILLPDLTFSHYRLLNEEVPPSLEKIETLTW
jgi:cytochrome c oxidase subunit 4